MDIKQHTKQAVNQIKLYQEVQSKFSDVPNEDNLDRPSSQQDPHADD